MICDIIRRMSNELKMRLTPPEPDIRDTDGFAKSDIFGHAEFGAWLANSIYGLQMPSVLALTSGWGNGKTVFAKQLAGELRNKWAQTEDERKAENAPVIYFDAFANDYQENALFALAGEVMKFIGRRGKITREVKKSVARIAKGVGSVMAEGVARYATGGLAGATNIADAMESALEKRMKEAGQGRDAICEFREALKDTAEKIGGGQPLVFIVDELDRCRPDFALEILEKIKHLFSVENVCFLVVTNLEQFKAVVQRTYGYSDDEARVYLDKFFHHVFRLPLSNQHPTFNVEKYISHLWDVMCFPPISDEMMQYMKRIAVHHEMSLRDIEQMFACAALIQLEGNSFRNFGPFMIVAALRALRKINPNVYGEILQGTASWDDLPPKIKQGPIGPVLYLIKGYLNEYERKECLIFLGTKEAVGEDVRRKLLTQAAIRIEQFAE